MSDSPSDELNDVLPLLRIGLEESAVIQGDDPDDIVPAPKPATGTHPRTGSARMWQPPSVEELQHALPQYEVQAFIARGGMGAVYRGVQRSLGRTVAIKILPPDANDDDEVNFAERFKREARAMASLSHPGIVAVHDAGEVVAGETGRGGDEETGKQRAALLFFVMEYIEGTDVAQLIASEGRVEPQRALAITAHVCDALAFAHESGIVHRDIKPSNIMIDKKGRVKVADFGLAKAVNLDSTMLTGSNMAMGTPDFVAPETLVAGTKVDQRADIYAVGVMLYQMLTGEIPRGRFELPSQMLPQLDARLDAVIDRAMQRDREKRYSSALDLRADLDAITTTPMAMPGTVGLGASPGSTGLPPAHPSTPPSGGNVGSHLAAKPRSERGAPRGRRALIAVPIVVILGIAAFFVLNKDKPEQGRAAAPKPPSGTVGQAPRLTTDGSPTPAGGAPALQSAASRYPVGQWVRPYQKATDIHQKWFDAGAKWEEGWITPGAGFNQSISLGAPNAQGRNWGARAKIRCGGGFTGIVLRRNGTATSNTVSNYEFRVTVKGGAEFVRGQGRGSVSGADRKPLGDPFPIPLTEGQEVLIEAFAIGDTLYGRVEGKVFSAKTDGMLKEGGFEVATQIMPCRDIEFINLDGLTEAEAKKAVGLE